MSCCVRDLIDVRLAALTALGSALLLENTIQCPKHHKNTTQHNTTQVAACHKSNDTEDFCLVLRIASLLQDQHVLIRQRTAIARKYNTTQHNTTQH